jgi:hypothetical protein
MNALALFFALIERLVGSKLCLDLIVFGQRLRVLRTQLTRSFTLGQSEILEAVLGHYPSGGGSYARAHLLLLGLVVFWHCRAGRDRTMIPQPENAAK